MQIDPPSQIVILGAGPVGLEAALYARYLGYRVQIFEAGNAPAENLRRWGHVRLFTPFEMNVSRLGVAALRAQDPNWTPPEADAFLTGAELRDRYLLPLAASDLLAESLHLNAKVVSVARADWHKRRVPGDKRRAESPFHILTETTGGGETAFAAEVVIDCTGTFSNPNSIGQGGAPAIGERAATDKIEHGLPDVLGAQRERYADQHTVVLGAGYSAATTITELAELAETARETSVAWLTPQRETRRHETQQAVSPLPIPLIPNDRLAARHALAVRANELATGGGCVTHRAISGVTAIHYGSEQGKFTLTLADEDASPMVADRVIANVGYRPDLKITRELQIHHCYASEAPMKLAAALLSNSLAANAENGAADCLTQTSTGAETLVTAEPNFYCLGAKSYGRGSNFLLRTGLEQIRELFTLLNGRPELDLYATMPEIASVGY